MSEKKTTEQFINDLNFLFPNEYNVLGEYISSKDPIRIQHKKCGYIWSPPATSMLKKNRDTSICPCCSKRVVVKGINDLWTTHPEIAKLLYNPEDGYLYSYGSREYVNWKCPCCHKITKLRSIAQISNSGFVCENCNLTMSLPNRVMYNLLNELGIPFNNEVRFDWCVFEYNGINTYGIYDFCFEYNNVNYIIEMDGAFHYGKIDISKTPYEEIHFRDLMKDKLAIENGFKIIRINCNVVSIQALKNNIISSDFGCIFDLKNINWNKCFYSYYNEEIDNIANMYNSGYTISDICNSLNMNYYSITKRLEIAQLIGLCNYAKNSNAKKIVWHEGNIIFQSETQAAKYFGIHHSSIDNSCRFNRTIKSRNNNQSYTFSFLNDYIEKYPNALLSNYE